MTRQLLTSASLVGLLSCSAGADVGLPSIFGDGMVLQRNTMAAVWGWARPGEKVRVAPGWGAPAAETTAGPNGRWRVTVQTPDAGGPYSLTVAGDTTVTLKDVLIGEVWVCSGQSNMEWSLAQSENADVAVHEADHPTIRLFTVPNVFSLHEQIDCGGEWSRCTPQSAAKFSAVGYYFGREIAQELNVPVGLISADWGGTRVEAWTSETTLSKNPAFTETLAQVRAYRDPETRAPLESAGKDRWWDLLDNEPGVKGWTAAGFDDSAWGVMTLPATLADDLARFDGLVRFRRVVELPAAAAGKPGTLELGPIDDLDDAWINGVKVGSTHEDGRWNEARKYTVPAGVLKAGANVIAVRMLDTAGLGGVNGAPEQMRLTFEGGKALPLAGEWRFAKGRAVGQLPAVPTPLAIRPNTPTVLYNGLIAPIAGFGMRGVIWYQGESNISDAEKYEAWFGAMVADWRRAWGIGDFPVYSTQIAPFDYTRIFGVGQRGCANHNTALLREAQQKALSIPFTGMAVTADIGNPADIHPTNKLDVGRRLSLWALAQTYGQAGVEYSGPMFSGWSATGSEARVTFEHGEDGLTLAPAPTQFQIAGDDKRFYRAAVRVDGASLVLSHPRVTKPAAVRYLWNAAGSAELFGAGGLPAAPFRSDSWSCGESTVDQEPELSALRTKEAGFKDLFNGRDLSGWNNVNCAPSTWTVGKDEDGGAVILCTGVPTGLLRTDGQYQNFVFEMEFRHMKAGGNAGLFMWSDALPVRGQPFTRSVEVQVMDGLEGEFYTSDGDIFPIHGATMKPENPRGKGNRAFPTSKRMNPSPMWNHYRVECIDGKISLAVNGEVVTRGSECSPRKGYICLESEGSPVQFRNLRIKELPGGTLAPEQVAREYEGFEPLYNGVDFAGWKFGKAHEGHWKAQDWTISFDGQGEDLWTEKSYKDFVLVCDWRWTGTPKETARPVILPDGTIKKDEKGNDVTVMVKDAGDSGIYLRGSSKSQVNMWCWPVGSGEVYGYRTDASQPAEVRADVTPREVADAPLGQWNRFEVTMKGERLTVVLNGKTVIENAHLPGVAPEGPIALQKHGDPIEFANIYIRELK